jgi:hypothetical protein
VLRDSIRDGCDRRGLHWVTLYATRLLVSEQPVNWLRLLQIRLKTQDSRWLAFCTTFVRVYSLFNCQRLSENIKLIIHQVAHSVCNDICLPRLGICFRHVSFETAASANLSAAHYWQFSMTHTDPRITRGFQNSVRVWFCYKIMQAAS